MTHWGPSLLESIRRSASAEQAFNAVAEAARELGFEWCAYGYQYPLPFTRARCFLISNYPESWQARYAAAEYLHVDPTVIRARRSLEPMVWSDALFCDAAQLWDEARMSGLLYGWAQSCFGPDGGVGLLSLARDQEPLRISEILWKEPQLRSLVNVAHAALSRFALDDVSRRLQRLTPRESEVMRWAGDGKTSEQTASILGLSRFTVEFHLKNAVRKLGAASRAAAAARAAAVGMLR